jgi:AP-4 complex subunit epsilon-1
MHLSKEFFELIKAIGEAKSKQEEDRIIMREVNTLKKKLESGEKTTTGLGMSGSHLLPGAAGGTPGNGLNSNKKKAREFLVRILYVEMLGHDGGFGYIKAVVSVAL